MAEYVVSAVLEAGSEQEAKQKFRDLVKSSGTDAVRFEAAWRVTELSEREGMGMCCDKVVSVSDDVY